MGMVKVAGGGGVEVARALQAFALKAEETTLRRFRRAVWAVYTRLLDTTPQFSGRAVANWNIGIDTPDLTFEDDVGDLDESVSPLGSARQVGDKGWIDYAKAKNEPRLALIRSRSRVFITNATMGDGHRKGPLRGKQGKGGGGTPYLLDLQSSAVWASVLRAENQPYETLADVMLMETWRQNLHRNTQNKGEIFFGTTGGNT